jgi:hypothetical protein
VNQPEPSVPPSPRVVTVARNIGRLTLRLAARIVNRTRKHFRDSSRRSVRRWKIAREAIKNFSTAVLNRTRQGVRRIGSIGKVFVRFQRRAERRSEQRAAVRLEQRVERAVLREASRGKPLLLGPWFSEVGFEVLYWVPFLRWLKAQTNWDPSQVVAVSRGGVASWYDGLASQYVDLFDYLDPPTFARRNLERREAGDGSHKQLTLGPLDQEIIDFALRQCGLGDAVVIHPSTMYQLFRNYWLGHRPVAHVQERTRYRLMTISSAVDWSALPERYVAVKAYTAASLPDTARNRAVVQAVVRHLADHVDVVTLDTGLAIDDHDDYRPGRHARVHNLADLIVPRNNLEVQAAVIARAQGFVGTCGSLTWLAPLLGVPTVALMSDSRFLYPHLYLARQVYLQHGAATFATVDVNAADILQIDFNPLRMATGHAPVVNGL